MAKLPSEEKAKLVSFLADLKDEQNIEMWAQEVRERVRLRVTSDRCGFPSGQESCADNACGGCIFNTECIDQPRGVSGSEGFEEDQLTARPKNWEPLIPYGNRGTPQDDCVIRNHGWCPKCKETLEECFCNSCVGAPELFEEK